MKILWITNVLFPDICNDLGITPPVTGGWMKSLANVLLEQYNNKIELAIAGLSHKVSSLYKNRINGITYYVLPFKENMCNYDANIESYWTKVNKDYNPDVVHIHGTEFAHGLAFIKVCGNDNVVISIQGLVRIISRYCLGNISEQELKKKRTIYDYLKGHLLDLPHKLEKRGELELEYLNNSKYIIGRTEWDKSHVWAVNPMAQYYVGNEILREPFYRNKWDLSLCKRHTIFLSQAAKPIKGFHKLIAAMPLVLKYYPDTKIFVAGCDFINRKTLKEKLKYGTYANYIRSLIIKYNLENNIVFLGLLDENQMVEQYMKTHVFISPSSIENSSNSVCEAQLLGVPCISSFVGGAQDLIEHNKSGLLYRFEEHEMLAYYICKYFSDDDFCNFISLNERKIAFERHNRIDIANKTIEIYKQIIYK